MRTDLEHFTVSHDAARSAVPGDIRAGIYVRISSDRTGAGLGVARQEEDCRAWCARHGWAVARVYVDNDVSAYSGRARPQWEALLGDIAAGLISAVVCWHVDRLTRSPRELEEVIDLHDRRGIMLATVTGEMDLATPADSDRLRRVLARRPGVRAADARRYLMSGIFTCGACGTPMLGRPHKEMGPRYACVKGPACPAAARSSSRLGGPRTGPGTWC
jgi:hypothetical protein